MKPHKVPDYLEFVREHACSYGPRGMSQKTSDYRTVALCMNCHREFHNRGELVEWITR
jgi:hypothetical protein